MPKSFKDKYFVKEELSNYKIHDKCGEMYDPDEFSQIADKFEGADGFITSKASSEEGAAQLLRLIKSIPKIKFNLTPEQELMVSTPENLLCLGRSGTGKTTSSALRLFATDAFYKYNEL
jgi:hypothetical protein